MNKANNKTKQRPQDRLAHKKSTGAIITVNDQTKVHDMLAVKEDFLLCLYILEQGTLYLVSCVVL